MITQTATGLNSRTEANPFDKNGFLPLITAPMYSVVDETNYQVFLDNKIKVCLPRGKGYGGELYDMQKGVTFTTVSLQDFITIFIDQYDPINWAAGQQVCIDTANGNMPQLHEAIRKAKEIHKDNLVIMAGNVASVEAFVKLAKTGVDYIRVGIGGRGGCNTTSNTGVGQENLEVLIKECKNVLENYGSTTSYTTRSDGRIPAYRCIIPDFLQLKTKIVADGISSYITQCQTKYGFNDNGYAAINKLLFAGADLVMIGKLFAQCLESVGEKRIWHGEKITSIERLNNSLAWDNVKVNTLEEVLKVQKGNWVQVKYSGMSTLEEQVKYQKSNHIKQGVKKVELKPSEGSVNWIPVRWTLSEWLHGSENQDEYPYLMGWVNSIKSVMAYTNKRELL